jgi:hypothetical protein
LYSAGISRILEIIQFLGLCCISSAHFRKCVQQKKKKKEFNSFSDFPVTNGNALSEVGNYGQHNNLKLFCCGVINLFWLVRTLAVMETSISEVLG